MTPESLNLPGDLILLGIAIVLGALPVALLIGLYRQQKRAMMERDK
jgi:hypothetical protein